MERLPDDLLLIILHKLAASDPLTITKQLCVGALLPRGGKTSRLLEGGFLCQCLGERPK